MTYFNPCQRVRKWQNMKLSRGPDFESRPRLKFSTKIYFYATKWKWKKNGGKIIHQRMIRLFFFSRNFSEFLEVTQPLQEPNVKIKKDLGFVTFPSFRAFRAASNCNKNFDSINFFGAWFFLKRSNSGLFFTNMSWRFLGQILIF